MLKSGAKVTVDKTDEGDVLTILPEATSLQQGILAVWLVVWVFCGMLALVGGLKELQGDEYTFLLVFFGFWAYFLFYAARSLVWMKVGAEYIRLTSTTIDYKRSWNGLGKVRSYQLSNLKNVGLINYDDKKFAKTYGDAFWTIGGEMIGFEHIGQKVAVGFKLTEAQAKDVVKRIQTSIKKARREESV